MIKKLTSALVLVLLLFMVVAQTWGALRQLSDRPIPSAVAWRVLGAFTGTAGFFCFFSKCNWRPETHEFRFSIHGPSGWREVSTFPPHIYFRFYWYASFYLPQLLRQRGEAVIKDRAARFAAHLFEQNPQTQRVKIELLTTKLKPVGSSYVTTQSPSYRVEFMAPRR